MDLKSSSPEEQSASERAHSTWELLTLNGRLPAVREIPQLHGEASRYEATIRTIDGKHVCKLDFGYGRKDDAEIAALIVHRVNSHDALVFALMGLVNEARGVLEFAERAIRDAVGHTNVACLRTRIDEAQVVIDRVNAKGR